VVPLVRYQVPDRGRFPRTRLPGILRRPLGATPRAGARALIRLAMCCLGTASILLVELAAGGALAAALLTHEVAEARPVAAEGNTQERGRKGVGRKRERGARCRRVSWCLVYTVTLSWSFSRSVVTE